ncbi:MAG TPA: ABC transporter substrate-binding protein [Candidatus Acidoferrales bacterium]|nr:ABC transporter substrate-binding protein [Candidatus Acidoferrales bacterium]
MIKVTRPAFVSGMLACAAAPVQAQTTLIPVKLGTINAITDAPLVIADTKGYFAAEGLKVDFVFYQSGATMVASLGSGQLDAIAAGTSAGMFNAVLRGLTIRIVADKATDSPGYGFTPLIVRTELIKNGRYKTIKDIKGMKIGVSAKGSSGWPQLDAVTRMAGIKFDDVENVPLDYSDHVVGLQNGSIDAGLTIEPFATLATDSGAATRVLPSDKYYPNQEVAVLMYGDSLLRGRRDAGLRFMRAYLKGARYYNDALLNGKLAGRTADDVIAIMLQKGTLKNADLYRRITPNAIDPNGKLSLVSIQRDFDVYKATGLIDGNKYVAAKDVVDTTFAEQAAKQLGPYVPHKQ